MKTINLLPNNHNRSVSAFQFLDHVLELLHDLAGVFLGNVAVENEPDDVGEEGGGLHRGPEAEGSDLIVRSLLGKGIMNNRASWFVALLLWATWEILETSLSASPLLVLSKTMFVWVSSAEAVTASLFKSSTPLQTIIIVYEMLTCADYKTLPLATAFAFSWSILILSVASSIPTSAAAASTPICVPPPPMAFLSLRAVRTNSAFPQLRTTEVTTSIKKC